MNWRLSVWQPSIDNIRKFSIHYYKCIMLIYIKAEKPSIQKYCSIILIFNYFQLLIDRTLSLYAIYCHHRAKTWCDFCLLKRHNRPYIIYCYFYSTVASLEHVWQWVVKQRRDISDLVTNFSYCFNFYDLLTLGNVG